MSLKRSWLACRLKTRVVILALLVIIISMALMYRALVSHTGRSRSQQDSMPSMDRRIRFHPKYSELDLVNPDDRVHKKAVQNVAHLRERDLLSADSKEAVMNFLKQLYPTDWSQATETDEIALELKYLLADYGFESKMTCQDIDRLKLGHPVAFSKSKYIEYAYDALDNNGNTYDTYYNRKPVGRGRTSSIIVKSPSSDVETKVACMKQRYDPDFCATMGNYKLLREILFMSTLNHPNILKLKGYCLRGNTLASTLQQKGLIMVTESGVALTPMVIRSQSWYQRVNMALQVVQLLVYLDKSPYGTLRLEKLELKDLILAGGETVKLADLDELDVGELTCQRSSQCKVANTEKGSHCVEGYCDGLNALINLNKATMSVMTHLLNNPDVSEAKSLITEMQSLSITLPELVTRLRKLLQETSRIIHRKEPPQAVDSRGNPVVHMSQNERDNNVRPLKGKKSEQAGHLLSRFERHDQSNFAGIYDYPCPGSRVSWGCVHTANSLGEVAQLCLQDGNCRCFITFTTKPEEESLMTVVLKNATDAFPQRSSGTTLFIRKSTKYDVILRGQQDNNDGGQNNNIHVPPIQEELSNVGDGGDRLIHKKSNVLSSVTLQNQETDDMDEEDEEEEEGNGLHARNSVETTACIDRAFAAQEAARHSREKRLMAHLGLKGTREDQWTKSASTQNLGSISKIVRVASGGGKFHVNLTKRFEGDPPESAKKAVFIAEDGPTSFHVAYALLYQLDRLLGLYHTPPCVGRTLTNEQVNDLQKNNNWEEVFKPLIEADGTLTGVMVVPTPKVMKTSKLNLLPLDHLTSAAKMFDRTEKLQVEYILLWWLGRVGIKQNEHIGYKGHLIHFHAEKAFTNTSADLSDYLHQCQFPSVAFKALNCFKCVDSTGAAVSADVCSLGEEVLIRTHTMLNDNLDFDLNGLSEEQIASSMNTAATDLLRIIDRCIKRFGREAVLY